MEGGSGWPKALSVDRYSVACSDCGVRGIGVPLRPELPDGVAAGVAAPAAAPDPLPAAGVAEVDREELPDEFLLREWLSC